MPLYVIRKPAPAPRFTIRKQDVHLWGENYDKGMSLKFPGGVVSVDTETTGLDPWGTFGVDRKFWPARPFMVTLGNLDGETAIIRWAVDPFTRKVIVHDKSAALLDTILRDPDIGKIFHNNRFDRDMLELSGFKIRGRIHDTLIGMHTVHSNEFNYQLKPLCEKYLNISAEDQEDLLESIRVFRRTVRSAQKHDPTSNLARYLISEEVAGDMVFGDFDLCEKYGRQDAYRTAALWLAVEQALDEDPALRKIYNREIELTEALKAMEDRGIRVDMDRVADCRKYYEEAAEKASMTIKAEVGPEFNPNSPKQMTKEFYGNRGYTPMQYSFDKKKGHTKCQHCKGDGCTICKETGHNPKCDAEFLQSIALEHYTDEEGKDQVREKCRLAHALLYESASGTMMSYIKQYEDYAVLEKEGVYVVHPNYKQHGTKTGRLSAEKPNLQNVASDDSAKKRVDLAYRSRECFIPRDGFVYYIPDYSQIEIWMLFLRAGAKEAIAALCAGGDAHQIVANIIWGHLYSVDWAKEDEKKDPKTLSPERLKNLKKYKRCRKLAKNLQFCKIYGGGTAKIAFMIGDGCTIEQATEFIEDYDERLPFVKRYMQQTINKAKRDGCIRNAYGRLYYIDRNMAYRATNYDIQGSAADLIKTAMIDTYKLSITPKYEGLLFPLLTIHDELLFEVHESINNEETMKAIVTEMTNDYKMLGCPIRFPVGMKIATERWSESLEVKVCL